MATGRNNPHVSPVGIEPERIWRNVKAATANRTTINRADCAAQFARASSVASLYRDEFEVLLEKDVDDYVEGEHYCEGIDY